MHEQFMNAITVILDDYITGEKARELITKIAVVANDYEITKRTTEIAVVEDIPQEMKAYLVTKKIEGMADGSLDQYRMALEEMFRYIQKPVNQIKTNDVRTYLYMVQKDRGISNRTLENRRSMISAFLEWCANEEYIQKNPTRQIKPIKFSSDPREPLSGIEMEMLRNACETLRDRAMIEFFYSTGCRVSEMVNMDLADVDFGRKEVVLFGKGSKYRTVYMNPKCEIALKRYLDARGEKHEDDALFTSERAPYQRMQKRGIETRIKKLGELAGISRNVFPHLIRHTAATDGLNRGMDITEVQRILGHSNINTTLIYSKVDADRTKSDFMRNMA